MLKNESKKRLGGSEEGRKKVPKVGEECVKGEEIRGAAIGRGGVWNLSTETKEYAHTTGRRTR